MKKEKRRILLLGASSYIGTYFWKRLPKESVVGTYASHPFPAGVRYNAIFDSLDSIISDLHNFSHAIILLGATDFERCAKDKKWSRVVNVDAIKRTIDTLLTHNIQIVFASSDYVFDGKRGNSRETDRPRPVITYGMQKYQIEKYLNQRSKRYLVVRFGKVYGIQIGDTTLFTSWIEKLLAGEPLTIATDQVMSPIWVEDLVTAVLKLIEQDAIGVFHVAGPRGYTRKQLFEMILGRQKKKHIASQVTYCSIDDFPFVEKRPHNISLSIEKLIKTTGFTPKDPKEIISLL